MEVRQGYKQTELGAVPEDWECERISDAAANSANAIVGGPFGSDLVSADYAAMGVPVIRGQNVAAGVVSGDFVFVSPQKAKSLSANLAHPGDLVFTQRGTLGQVAIVLNDRHECYLVSQSQMKVSLNRTRHDPCFVHQYFASRAGQKQIALSAIQTGVPHTNLGILRAYRFPAPPLPEQRAIAAALSDVDALLGGLDRLIAKKRDLKQAAMQQLLTGQTRLPGFQGEWELRRLGDVSNMGSGGTPLSSVPAYYGGGIPWVSIADMTRAGRVIDETEKTLTTLGLESSAAQMFPACTVLYAMYASLGECCIAGVPVTTSQAILGIRPKHQLVGDFLYYFLSSLKAKVRTIGQQGTQANLNKGIVQDFRIALPSHEEQAAIATVLSDMDAELTTLEARRDKTHALKQGMMQELLTGRTRLVRPEQEGAAAC